MNAKDITMFGKDNSITFQLQLQHMRIDWDALTKILDEAAAYNMVDQGDNFDAVRAKLRSGYEISHLEVSDDVFEKLARMTINNETTPLSLFDGINVKRCDGIGAGMLRVALVKSWPRTPSTPDFLSHTDYTPITHLQHTAL